MNFYIQKNRREQPSLKLEVDFLKNVIFLHIWYQMKDKYLLFQYQLSPTRKNTTFAVINQLTRVGDGPGHFQVIPKYVNIGIKIFLELSGAK